PLVTGVQTCALPISLSGESGSPLNSFESKRSRQLFDDPAAETRTGFSGRLFSTALRFFPRSRGVVPSNRPQQLVAGRRSTPAESCFSSSVRVRTFRSSRAVVLVVSCNSAGIGPLVDRFCRVRLALV